MASSLVSAAASAASASMAANVSGVAFDASCGCSERFRRGFRCIMRMHAHGCIDEGVLPGQAQGGFQVRRTAARANGHHALDASLAGALDHLVAVRVELLVIQMAVRIDQLHLRRAPMGTSSRKPASTGLPPSMDPATII